MTRGATFVLLLCSTLACFSQADPLWSLLYGYPTGLRSNEDSTSMIFYGDFIFADSSRANGLANWDSVAWDITEFYGGSGDTSSWDILGVSSMALRNDTLLVGLKKNNSWVWQNDSAFGNSAYLANGQWHTCGDPDHQSEFLVMEAHGRIFGFTKYDSLYSQYSPGLKEWRNGEYSSVKGHANIDPVFMPNSVTYWNDQYYFIGKNDTWPSGDRALWIYDGDSTWTGQTTTELLEHYEYTRCEGYGDSLYYVAFPGIIIGTQSGDQSVIWNGSNWVPFFQQFPYSLPLDVKSHNSYLYFSGRFSFNPLGPFYRLIRFDGQQLCAIGDAIAVQLMDMYPFLHLGFLQNDLYATDQGWAKAFKFTNIDQVVPDTCLDVTVGNEELLTQSMLSVFPNPFGEAIEFIGDVEGWNFELINMTGTVLKKGVIRNGRIFGLASLSSGYYTLVLNHDGIERRFKVIKQ